MPLRTMETNYIFFSFATTQQNFCPSMLKRKHPSDAFYDKKKMKTYGERPPQAIIAKVVANVEANEDE